jgi:hypothetical protein
MKLWRWTRKLALPTLALSLAACGGEETNSPAPGVEAEDTLSVVEVGKEDNFRSETAQEYMLTGTTTVTLEAEYAGKTFEERLARAEELIPFRQTVIAWFLNAYMVEKSSKDPNKDYGGFKGLTKNGSWEDLNIREVEGDELTFAFDFRQEIAGPLNLLSVMPVTADAEGNLNFDLILGKISTADMLKLDTNNEWYRKSPWSGFNPETVDADRLETVTLTIEAQPRSSDAWFDYAPLIDDGVLDIGVHYGWDYHKEYHLVHSETAFDWMVRRGFKAPVDTWDELGRDSGPFTKSMLTPLGPVEVRVSLYFGKIGTDTDPDTDAGGRALEDDMRQSFKERDVIMFSGHSGPFYGFALANWRKTSEGDLDDSEIAGLEMPDRYQVVLAEGCDTYAVGQAFFLNPAKTDRTNVDVITTTTYSDASSANAVIDFLTSFVGDDADAELREVPRLSTLLKDLDDNSFWFTTMYGIHGIDDNPRAHPFADQGKLCGECNRNADCGGMGNLCVKMADGAKACTYECTADDACGEGFVCQGAQSDGWVRTKVCVSLNATCEVPDVATPELQLSKVIPNPATDWNGDGVVSARADELVEITNVGTAEADLTGYALTDNTGVRFTFPAGVTLLPGESLQVLGGGDAEFVAPRSLGLNNNGDTLTLLDDRGAKLKSVSWRRAQPGNVLVGD